MNNSVSLFNSFIWGPIGAGSDVAVETGDIALVKIYPEDVVNRIDFSEATYCNMFQNLLWATGYNLVVFPLADGE